MLTRKDYEKSLVYLEFLEERSLIVVRYRINKKTYSRISMEIPNLIHKYKECISRSRVQQIYYKAMENIYCYLYRKDICNHEDLKNFIKAWEEYCE